MYTQEQFLWASEELSTSEKCLLLAIRFRIGAKSESYVSQKRLAKDTSLTRATVLKLVNRLEAHGWLRVQRRRNDHATHIYSLPKDKFPPFESKIHTTPVKSLDTPLYNDLTGVCITNLHKVNNRTKNKENLKSKAFAGEPAKPSISISPDNSGKVQKPNPEKQDETHNGNTVYMLQHIWKSTVAKTRPDIKKVSDFTSKQLGQAKHIINKIQPLTAAEIVPFILEEWCEYGRYVKECTGSSVYPTDPSIGYLLKHCSEAVNFYLREENRRHEEAAYKATLAEEKLSLTQKKAAYAEEQEKRYQEFKAMNIEVTLDNYDDLYKQKYISYEEWKQWEAIQYDNIFQEHETKLNLINQSKQVAGQMT
ncbi:MAG TPA: helix-turn-helix domain-containing protein [Geobacteraceae bacterium]